MTEPTAGAATDRGLAPPPLVAVGRVVRPQGRRGEVRLVALTDDPGRLRELAECHLVPPPAGERRTVEAVWCQGEAPVVKLEGSESIADAEALVGRFVAIPGAAVRPLPPDHFYAFDLIGCAVETPDGAPVGVVDDVRSGPAHDWWVVRAGARERLVPAVLAIVERVDLARRRVVIRPPEGLLDL